ncbi:unnamed protein product [Amaranthus hypochondriacus]
MSPSITKSTGTNIRTKSVIDSNLITKAFGTMVRHQVDMAIVRAVAINGLSYNVLRNPDFHNMVTAINNVPKGYKAPLFDRARTSLTDDVKREVEKVLAPVMDTWST